jgi:hypothetical protein
MRSSSIKNLTANKGSALAISLVILTAITLISVTALQRSGLQGRMVGNVQHQEQGFHAANGELEEIYHFYATQASATQALSNPLNSYDVTDGERVYSPVDPGHESSYNAHDPSSSSQNYKKKPRLAVGSSIVHSGVNNTLVEGFSVGTFVEKGFVISSASNEPSFGLTPGRMLSSQSIGMTFIAPAGNVQ